MLLGFIALNKLVTSDSDDRSTITVPSSFAYKGYNSRQDLIHTFIGHLTLL